MKYPIGVAVGFLFQPTSGKVLLRLRRADAPPNAGKWAFFGGHREPEDGGNLLTTPDLADYAREDLCRFREHLAQEGRLERET
jgi:8-oxo-dGTP pyrophosphatase MutT (NUDIX family)